MVDITDQKQTGTRAAPATELFVSPDVTGAHLTREQRVATGKAARASVPLEAHAEFDAAPTRDPVGLLLSQSESRVPELVPVRHGRMLVSPFTYYRGAALPMAADLADTPIAGSGCSCAATRTCPTSGCSGRPSGSSSSTSTTSTRRCPGPWEWDVKRLAASFEVAGARQRLHREAAGARSCAGGPRLPRGDAGVRGAADHGRLVRAPRHGRAAAAVPVAAERRAPQGC